MNIDPDVLAMRVKDGGKATGEALGKALLEGMRSNEYTDNCQDGIVETARRILASNEAKELAETFGRAIGRSIRGGDEG